MKEEDRRTKKIVEEQSVKDQDISEERKTENLREVQIKRMGEKKRRRTESRGEEQRE